MHRARQKTVKPYYLTNKVFFKAVYTDE